MKPDPTFRNPAIPMAARTATLAIAIQGRPTAPSRVLR